MKLRNDNAYAKICDDNDKSVPCPDLILLSTSQVTIKYITFNYYYYYYY